MEDKDPTPLPDDVAALLRDRIHSFEELELLLLLREHHGERFTPEVAATHLKMAPMVAAEALEHLFRGNLLEGGEGGGSMVFGYSPRTPALDQAVTLLAQAYGERRMEVVRALSANAIERLRTSTMRVFADAFLIGGKKNDG